MSNRGALRVTVLGPRAVPDPRVSPVDIPTPSGGSSEADNPGPAITLHDALHATLRGPGGSTSRVLVVPAGPLDANAWAGQAVTLVIDGWEVALRVEDANRARLRGLATRGERAAAAGQPSEVRAIIPGRVAGVTVQVGQQVAEGQLLLVLEAMKMQNELRSLRPGIVTRIVVEPGVTVEAGDLLVVIE